MGVNVGVGVGSGVGNGSGVGAGRDVGVSAGLGVCVDVGGGGSRFGRYSPVKPVTHLPKEATTTDPVGLQSTPVA